MEMLPRSLPFPPSTGCVISYFENMEMYLRVEDTFVIEGAVCGKEETPVSHHHSVLLERNGGSKKAE
jgi:hypothetical protein